MFPSFSLCGGTRRCCWSHWCSRARVKNSGSALRPNTSKRLAAVFSSSVCSTRCKLFLARSTPIPAAGLRTGGDNAARCWRSAPCPWPGTFWCSCGRTGWRCCLVHFCFWRGARCHCQQHSPSSPRRSTGTGTRWASACNRWCAACR